MGSMKDLLGDRFALPNYPSTPGFTDGNTSRAAADAVTSGVEQARLRVLAELRERPGTADEVAKALGLDKLYVRPRVSELVKDGRAIKTNVRRKNDSGLSAAVHKATGGAR